MEPTDIASVTVDGQVVYYRPGEVIAVGETARTFVEELGGTFEAEGEAEGLRRTVGPRGASQADGLVSMRPTAYRLIVPHDPLTVVQRARSSGLRVQLNHVHFAHCGCACDPCCGSNSYGANPYRATGYLAKPYRATPYRATPARTSAIETVRQTLGGAEVPEAAGDSAVKVWILDTGLADTAEVTALDGRGVDGDFEDQADRQPPPFDGLVDPVAGHGTFIAGIIKELAPACAVKVRRVIEPAGDVDEWDVSDAIYELLGESFEAGAKLDRTILNLSFGGALYDACSPVVGEAIADAQEAGVVVVASAGNESSCRPVYPAHFPGVVAVGAVDVNGDPADFTNVGSWVQACALGVDVTSTFFEFDETNTANVPPGSDPLQDFDGWAIWSGTSFAAPVVVASIAQKLQGDSQKSASAALAETLAAGTPIPCLGVRVIPTRVEKLVPEARPVEDNS